MLLPGACALDRLLVFELRLDGLLSGAALSAHELCASTSPLVVVQHLSCELQMALVAALHARIRVDIARAETSCRASQAHRVTFVLLRITQHDIVEVVCGQVFAARVAAPSLRVALASDALFRVAFEAPWGFLNFARGARVATTASESPILCVTCRIVPLRAREFLSPASFAAY